ncbi:MAG: hypothetical protein HYT65_00010 [Candidatus Yanofskybacteria bacterium]|nr:hypothetical protein [Candidatus Yanofskybacteria bacterium]
MRNKYETLPKTRKQELQEMQDDLANFRKADEYLNKGHATEYFGITTLVEIDRVIKFIQDDIKRIEGEIAEGK